MHFGEIIEFALTAALLAVLVVCVVVIIRRVWLALTNPQVAYQLGRKTRRAVEGAARTAGQATGTAEGVVGVVGRSFREGRDSAKGKDGAPEGDA